MLMGAEAPPVSATGALLALSNCAPAGTPLMRTLRVSEPSASPLAIRMIGPRATTVSSAVRTPVVAVTVGVSTTDATLTSMV